MRGRWFAAAVLLALAFPARSAAHASFATSHPAPGSNVRVAPTQITMTFGEPLNRRVSAAELLDAHGVAIHARLAFPNPEALALVPGRRLPAGAYLVRWHSVAVDDGHALDGSFGFGVRTAGAAGLLDDGAPALAASTFARLLARWALYAGALCFAGALSLEALAPGWLTPAALAPASPDVLATVRKRSRLMVRGAGVL